MDEKTKIDINIVEYLHGFGAELGGLNPDCNPAVRKAVLTYVIGRFEEVMNMVRQEVNDG